MTRSTAITLALLSLLSVSYGISCGPGTHLGIGPNGDEVCLPGDAPKLPEVMISDSSLKLLVPEGKSVYAGRRTSDGSIVDEVDLLDLNTIIDARCAALVDPAKEMLEKKYDSLITGLQANLTRAHEIIEALESAISDLTSNLDMKTTMLSKNVTDTANLIMSVEQNLERSISDLSDTTKQLGMKTNMLSKNITNVVGLVDSTGQNLEMSIGSLSNKFEMNDHKTNTLSANITDLVNSLDMIQSSVNSGSSSSSSSSSLAIQQEAGATGNTVEVLGQISVRYEPIAVVSATCTADNIYGTESACPGDDNSNAKRGLKEVAGSITYQAAHGGHKTYEHVFDLGFNISADAVELTGYSEGCWCGEAGSSCCHNDNNFKFSFSTSRNGPFVDVESVDFVESCSRLDDGCKAEFDPTSVSRYMKLTVKSGCSGCSNKDYVETIVIFGSTTGTQFAIDAAGNTGFGVDQAAAALHVGGNFRALGGQFLSDGSEPPFVTSTVVAGDREPVSLVSARCYRTLVNSDPGAAEPNCASDDTANAMKALGSGSIAYYVARTSSSYKYYEHIFDFGEEMIINSFELIGSSTGHWCEDGLLGAANCHNDNSFMPEFSLERDTGYAQWEEADHQEACNNLSDGCLTFFKPLAMRYLKLVVRSGCHGCTNTDYVDRIVVKAITKTYPLRIDNEGSIFIQGRKLNIETDGTLKVN